MGTEFRTPDSQDCMWDVTHSLPLWTCQNQILNPALKCAGRKLPCGTGLLSLVYSLWEQRMLPNVSSALWWGFYSRNSFLEFILVLQIKGLESLFKILLLPLPPLLTIITQFCFQTYKHVLCTQAACSGFGIPLSCSNLWSLKHFSLKL